MDNIKDHCKNILLRLKDHPDGSIYWEVEKIGKLRYLIHFKDEINEQNVTSDDEIRALLEIRTNQSEDIPKTVDDVWIFGYGSLVWKADFPFIDRRPGFITGYQRRFYQNSIDHRGTPTRPGRVVTLVPTHKLDDRVYGMAYRIAAKHKDDVQRHLDHREKNGYERCVLRFHEYPESTDSSFDVIMYIATAENESYAGHISDLSAIADQIFTSFGPSGSNREYLFHLAKAMRILFPGVNDEHLYELEAAVMRLVTLTEPIVLEEAIAKKIAAIYSNKLKACIEEQIDMDICEEKIDKEVFNLRESILVPGHRELILSQNYPNQII